MVYVHIWDDNCNVYADRNAAFEGITEGGADEYDVDVTLAIAESRPGDAAYLDNGMSVIRYVSISH